MPLPGVDAVPDHVRPRRRRLTAVATYRTGTGPQAASTVNAARVGAALVSAEQRRCPKCQRKGALIRFDDAGAYGASCRWINCDYADRTIRDSGERTTTDTTQALVWDQVLPGCTIVYQLRNMHRTMVVTECHDTADTELKQVYGTLIGGLSGRPLGPKMNSSRRRPGERSEMLHISMVRTIIPATAKAATA